MFKSIGSNFGAPEITFQDYQNEHEIVLNAVFTYDSTGDNYRNASVLEIYVPDLSLAKSAVAGVFFAAMVQGNWIGSTLKCWIKDKNTLCVWRNLLPGMSMPSTRYGSAPCSASVAYMDMWLTLYSAAESHFVRVSPSDTYPTLCIWRPRTGSSSPTSRAPSVGV